MPRASVAPRRPAAPEQCDRDGQQHDQAPSPHTLAHYRSLRHHGLGRGEHLHPTTSMSRPCRGRQRESLSLTDKGGADSQSVLPKVATRPLAACLDSASAHCHDAFALSGWMITFDGPMPMLRETDAFNEAGRVSSSSGTARPSTPGVLVVLATGELVWVGRGVARSRRRRFPQANIRPRSSRADHASFRVADPGDRSDDLPRAGFRAGSSGLVGKRGAGSAPRLLCGLTLLPPLWAASPRIFGPGRARPGPGCGDAVGARARAAGGRLWATGPDQLSGSRRCRVNPGGIGLGP